MASAELLVAPPASLPSLHCVVIGDGAVGKTSFIARIAGLSWEEVMSRSLSESYRVAVLGHHIHLFDTSGQEDDLASAKPALYSSANAFVLCYSIISPSSYESVRSKWLSEIRHYNTHAPILLVGTKPDLRDNPHIVSRLQERDLQPLTYKQGHQLAKEIGALHFAEVTSVAPTDGMTDEELSALFQATIKELVRGAKKKTMSARCVLL